VGAGTAVAGNACGASVAASPAVTVDTRGTPTPSEPPGAAVTTDPADTAAPAVTTSATIAEGPAIPARAAIAAGTGDSIKAHSTISAVTAGGHRGAIVTCRSGCPACAGARCTAGATEARNPWTATSATGTTIGSHRVPAGTRTTITRSSGATTISAIAATAGGTGTART
jgi:hypothetical protein